MYRSPFYVLVGSGAAAQAVMFVGVLVLARLYEPAVFGEYGLYAGIASFVAVVSGLRFDYLAFSDTDRESSAILYYKASLFISILVATLALIVATLIQESFSDLHSFPGWVFLFTLSFSWFYLSNQFWLASGNYKAFARARLAQVVLQIGAACLLFWVLPGTGLHWAFIGSQLALAILAIVLLGGYRPVDVGAIRKLMVRRHRPALMNTLLSVLQYSTPFAPVLFGYLFYSKEDVGAYFVFAQMFAAPLGVFRRSILNYLNAETASVSSASLLLATIKAKMRPVLGGGLRIGAIALVCVITAVFLWVFRSEIVTVILGSKWSGYVALLLPLAIYFLLDVVLQPILTLFPLWGRTRVALVYEVTRVIVVYGGAIFVGSQTEISFTGLIWVYVVSMCVLYVVQAIHVYGVVQAEAPAYPLDRSQVN